MDDHSDMRWADPAAQREYEAEFDSRTWFEKAFLDKYVEIMFSSSWKWFNEEVRPDSAASYVNDLEH